MLQGCSNVPCATRDEANVDDTDGINNINHFRRNKSAGEISHAIFDERISLSLPIDLPPKALPDNNDNIFKEDSHQSTKW